MTVAEMLERMTSNELSGWLELAEMDAEAAEAQRKERSDGG